MNTHERDGTLLERLATAGRDITGKAKKITVNPQYISTRAAGRRAMRREIVAECKKLGVTWRQARKYMREELKQKPTLSNMHREIVESKGGEPC